MVLTALALQALGEPVCLVAPEPHRSDFWAGARVVVGCRQEPIPSRFSFPQLLLRTLILTRLTQGNSGPRAGCQGKQEVAVLGSTKQDGWLPR